MGKTLFVSGRLASPSLRRILESAGIEGDVFTLPLDVAALATTHYIARTIGRDDEHDLILIPGLCAGNVDIIDERTGVKAERGPRDLLDLPEYFGKKKGIRLDEYDTRIFAEINDAPSLTLDEIKARASYYSSCGADVIDIGCSPEAPFPHLAEVVCALKRDGFSVSIDTLNPQEILEADGAGVDYVLSLTSETLDLACKLEAVPVLIPDADDTASLDRNIAALEEMGKKHIADPLLSPLMFGFADSLSRFRETRKNHPRTEMLAGIGNVVELCDADSVGMHALLAGFCQELGVRNVLTTEASRKTRGAVRELDAARRMMYFAKRNEVLPRSLSDELLVAKEANHATYDDGELHEMQRALHPRDLDFRIFVSDKIHVFNGALFVSGTKKEELFERLRAKDAGHAFYLGAELERAELALMLGKKYVQERPLRWGYVGKEEE